MNPDPGRVSLGYPRNAGRSDSCEFFENVRDGGFWRTSKLIVLTLTWVVTVKSTHHVSEPLLPTTSPCHFGRSNLD